MNRVAMNAVMRFTNSHGERLPRGLPDRREEILGSAEAGHRERILIGRDADEIDDSIDGQPSHQLAPFVHHRHGHEVVSLERARGLRGCVGRPKRQRIGVHDGGDRHVGPGEDECLQAHGAAQQVSSIHDEQAVEMFRQIGPCLEIAQHFCDGLRLAHGGDFGAHEASHRLRRILISLLEEFPVDLAQHLTHVAHDLFGQVVGDPCHVIGVERGDDLDEPVRVGLIDEPRAYRGIELDQGFGSLRRLERVPDLEPIFGLEAFEHERQIRRMEASQPALQIDDVLTLLQLHGDTPLRSVLTARQRLQRAMMFEQRRDLLKGLMKVRSGSSIRHNPHFQLYVILK